MKAGTQIALRAIRSARLRARRRNGGYCNGNGKLIMVSPFATGLGCYRRGSEPRGSSPIQLLLPLSSPRASAYSSAAVRVPALAGFKRAATYADVRIEAVRPFCARAKRVCVSRRSRDLCSWRWRIKGCDQMRRARSPDLDVDARVSAYSPCSHHRTTTVPMIFTSARRSNIGR